MPKKAAAKHSKTKTTYAAPALEKAVDIMELLANAPGGLSISDMAANLGRSIGELFRLVIVMERRGLLERDTASERYLVSFKLLDLAFRAKTSHSLTMAAAPIMYSLAERIGQSCHLVVANAGQGLVVARNENPGPRGFSVRLGAAVDLVQSCSGHVILAFSEKVQVDRLLSQLPDGELTNKETKRLEEVLEKIRSCGYDLRPSPITYGVTDISYPVWNFDGRFLAALTVPFLELIDGSQRVKLADARQELSSASQAISAALGWPGPRKERPTIEPGSRRRRGKTLVEGAGGSKA